MKNLINKIPLFLALGAVFALVSPSQVQAGFGVSPSNIVHEQLRPGGSFEKEITLSRSDPNKTLEVVIEPSLDEMKDWFTFEPGMKFTFPVGETRRTFKAIVNVPKGIDLKHYEGVIRVKASSSDEVAGGVNIVQGARLQVDIVTTNAEIVQLEAKNLQMRDVSGAETLKLDMNVTNNGTTPASPWVRVTTLNLFQDELETLEDRDLEAVAANETKQLTAEFDTQLGTGEYFAQVEIMHNDQLIRKERLVFRISDREEGYNKASAGTTDGQGGRNWLSNVNIALFALLLVLLAVGYVFIRNKTPKKYAHHQSKITAAYFASLIAIFSLTVWQLTPIVTPQSEEQTSHAEPLERQESDSQESEQVEEQTESEIQTEETQESSASGELDSGEVQGAFDVATPEPVIVKQANQEQSYPVYAQQDTASEVIYVASEDETLEVLEETSRWYRVMLPSGTDGWLSKSNVKQVN